MSSRVREGSIQHHPMPWHQWMCSGKFSVPQPFFPYFASPLVLYFVSAFVWYFLLFLSLTFPVLTTVTVKVAVSLPLFLPPPPPPHPLSLSQIFHRPLAFFFVFQSCRIRHSVSEILRHGRLPFQTSFSRKQHCEDTGPALPAAVSYYDNMHTSSWRGRSLENNFY